MGALAFWPTRPRKTQTTAPARLTKPKTLRASFQPMASDNGAAMKVDRDMARAVTAKLSPFTQGKLAGAEPVHEQGAQGRQEDGEGCAEDDPRREEHGVVEGEEGEGRGRSQEPARGDEALQGDAAPTSMLLGMARVVWARTVRPVSRPASV